MKNFTLLAAMLCCFVFAYGQQEIQSKATKLTDAVSYNKLARYNNSNHSLKNSSSTCGVDTVRYTLAKLSDAWILDINTNVPAFSQYFDTPQPITVHGFDWYGWQTDGNANVVDITCSIYEAGVDSFPLGAPLASVVIQVDSTNDGTWGSVKKEIIFNAPVTVSVPYVLTVETNSNTNVGVIFNSWFNGDGGQEWLFGVNVDGVGWLKGRDITSNGVTVDADVLMAPHVSYDLTADFDATPPCLTNPPTSVAFTDNSSPILQNRMYNSATYWGFPELSYTYDYGDGSPTENLINPTHTFNTNGPFTTTLTDTLYGWTIVCGSSTSAVFGSQVQAAFSSTNNNPTVNFSDQSPGIVQSWLWDFGDGNTSTQQHPTHTYAADGTYTVCLTVTNSCGTDSTCQNITIIGTGIDQNALEQTLNVYPNPAKDVLQVALSYSGNKNLSIKMVDLTGKTVMHKTMTNANAQLITLNTSTLSEGIYILHVNTNNESVARKVTIMK